MFFPGIRKGVGREGGVEKQAFWTYKYEISL
jgi:hypothetical protein